MLDELHPTMMDSNSKVNSFFMLGIKQTVYSRYERGFQNIPIELLLQLADFYGTSTDYILGRTNEFKPYPKIK